MGQVPPAQPSPAALVAAASPSLSAEGPLAPHPPPLAGPAPSPVLQAPLPDTGLPRSCPGARAESSCHSIETARTGEEDSLLSEPRGPRQTAGETEARRGQVTRGPAELRPREPETGARGDAAGLAGDQALGSLAPCPHPPWLVLTKADGLPARASASGHQALPNPMPSPSRNSSSSLDQTPFGSGPPPSRPSPSRGIPLSTWSPAR